MSRLPTLSTPSALPARLAAVLALVAALAVLAGCATGWGGRAPWEGPASPQTQAVEKAVDRAYRHTGTVTVAMAYMDLATGGKVMRNENRPFHAASTMKVPVMIAAWAAVDQGVLRIDQPIAVRNEFRSIIDGSRFHLAPEDDGDPDLYAAVGSTRPLSELIRHMIVRSSNLATNLLIDQLSASRVMDVMRQMGAYNLQVLRGVEDEKAYQAGFNNEVNAADLMLLLAGIARAAAEPAAAAAPPDPGANEPVAAPAISHRGAAAMIEVLEAQEFNEKIPAGLPPGTPVAHKTGDITGIHHDAGIVFAPGEAPYVLVVLTAGFDKEETANRFIASLSRSIWEARHLPPPPPPRGHR
ncbi:MAG TPA: serine hydrolase [Thermoanaerobaculia bacterium]|nr:serine hydrolase [Thermoanaerobaculia bacterium]